MIILLFVYLISEYLNSTYADSVKDASRCQQALACEGTWESLDYNGWKPPFKVNKRLANPFLILTEGNYYWMSMVGDSNMRHLYYEVVAVLCKKDITCSLYIPFQPVKVKKAGEDPMSFRSGLSDSLTKGQTGDIIQSHQDHDIIFESSFGKFRVSFRMVVGEIVKTKRTLENLKELYCVPSRPHPEGCKTSFKIDELIPPVFKNFPEPNILYINDGFWDFNNLLDADLQENLFHQLSCSFNATR